MQFEPLRTAGAWLISTDKAADERGFFARIICVKEFAARGLNGNFVQASLSHNKHRGTVRGLHFQWPPSREAKLVRCVRGTVHDMLLDLRPDSATFLQHVTVTLDETAANAVYIPPGFGHGFQTLADDSMVQYHMTDEFRPELGDGFCWNDPAFGISLPLPVSVISARDATYAPFQRMAYEKRFMEGQGASSPP